MVGMTSFKRARQCFYKLRCFLSHRANNPEELNDLAQQIHLRLLQIDDATLQKKPLKFLNRLAASVLADSPSAAEDPGELEDDRLQQQIDHIYHELATMPPTQAAALVAHKRDRLPYETIAEKLGLSVKDVETQIVAAKLWIRRSARAERGH